MLILNGGVPRSGTTWVFNILRAIFDSSNVEYDALPGHTEEDVEDAIRGYSGRPRIIHYHDVYPCVLRLGGMRDVISFYNFRDPRDTAVSMWKLHGYTIDEAIENCRLCFQGVPQATRIPGTMFIPYEHLIAAPEIVVFEIGQRLGMLLRLDEAKDIVSETHSERYSAVMDRVANAPEPDATMATIDNGIRTIRYDRQTLINDRHIQSGDVGRWRRELSQEEQARAQAALAADCHMLGYAD